mgnify:CR=1 FL=1
MTMNDDIGKCLTSLGIEKRQIIPTNIAQRALNQQHIAQFNQFQNEINIFPLQWFDNGDGSDSEFLKKCGGEGKFKGQFAV